MTTSLARLKALTREKRLPQSPSKPSKLPFEGFEGSWGRPVSQTKGIAQTSAAVSEPLTDDEQERAGLAAGNVPAAYLDAWARLQCQRPAGIDPDTRRQAIGDAGLILDKWGTLAAQWGWLPGDLFDIPRNSTGGLAWFARGCAVVAFGPEHARLSDNRIFDRMEVR